MNDSSLSPVKKRFIENVKKFVASRGDDDPLFRVLFVTISAAAAEGQEPWPTEA